MFEVLENRTSEEKMYSKISVIIPCYNVENYIERCLDSLIRQTLRDIEIICVDDGSSDFTLEKIKSYAQKDSRIKYISQLNQKQGAARNRGLEIAKGEYIAFVDSDDFVDLNYCEALYNTAKKYDADIAVCSMRREKGSKQKYFIRIEEEKEYADLQDFLSLLNQQWQVCSKLFRAEIAKEIKFPEGIFFEDDCYTVRFFARAKKFVTVPNCIYHYVSNPKSTIKRKDLSLTLDRVEASLDVIKFAKENNIQIPERLITKKSMGLIKIKYYIDREVYYFCGIKLFSLKVVFDDSKTFLVFNTAYFGDVLLCNSLVQNIKIRYPKSKVIFICDKPFEDAVKFQEGVDSVIVYDKRGSNKGFWGLLKFIKNFPKEKIFASFITYENYRNWMISKLLRVKYIFNGNEEKESKRQYRHALMLKNISNGVIKNLPIKYNVPKKVSENIEKICAKNKNIVSLCMTSKKSRKDMSPEVGADIIKKLTALGKKVVFVGVGEKAVEYSKYFESLNLDFINLIDKTNIPELAYILKKSETLISIDTGTLHMGYAVGTPTIAVFYDSRMAKIWAPEKEIYKTELIDSNQTADNILAKLNESLVLNR